MTATIQLSNRIFAEAGKPRKTPSKALVGSGAGQYAPGGAQAICKGFATGSRGDSGKWAGFGKEENIKTEVEG